MSEAGSTGRSNLRCIIDRDAVPYERSNSTSSFVTSISPSTPLSHIDLTVNKVQGHASINGIYNLNNYGGSSNAMQTTVYINDDSSDSSNDSYCAQEESPELEVDENILKSSLSLSSNNMYTVAENIGKKYMKLSRLLKGARFTTSDIQNIANANKDLGQVEVVYAILERWTQKTPNSATVGNLAATLVELDRVDIAKKLSLDESHLEPDD